MALPVHVLHHRQQGAPDLVRRRPILFGEQEIEGWSYRSVARAQGIEPLPHIRVPKPKKKGG